MNRLALTTAILFAACGSALAQDAKTIKVHPDGTGDFKTVQAAVDSIPAKNESPVVIELAPGTYKERIRIRERRFVTLRGSDPKTTVLTWDFNAKSVENGKAVGTSGSFTVEVRADDFTAENVTFENSSGDNGQAVALSARGDRQVYKNCRMLGWQDTLLADNRRQYYVDCYIEGRVDFIFGGATAVFERCTIHSKNGGYVTAASTEAAKPFGYVFLDCKLTGDDVPWDPATTNPASTQPKARGNKTAQLGRPWRPNAAVAFIRCEIGDHIDPVGWNNWGKAENEQTARYAEYANTGPGADRSKRVPWARELSKDEAEKITAKSVLAGDDNWDPTSK